MTVINVSLKKDGRQIRQKFDGQWRRTIRTVNNNGSITTSVATAPVVKTLGTVVYVVEVDRADEQPILILQDRRLPQLAANYVENGVVYWDVYFVDATPRFIGPVGSLYRWEITYNLGGEFSNAPQQTQGTQDETLLNFSISTELEETASAVDLDGVWNVNSIGDFFADPIVYQTGILNLNYSRREYSNPLAKVFDFFQVMNGVEWYGFAPGTVKVADITFSATETATATTYDVDYKLQFRRKGWNVEKANSGLYYLYNSVKTRALNDDGSPADEPVLLAANGAKLAPGAAPVFRSFRVHPTADLYDLNLPNPFEL